VSEAVEEADISEVNSSKSLKIKSQKEVEFENKILREYTLTYSFQQYHTKDYAPRH
jgi:hypothetical protein